MLVIDTGEPLDMNAATDAQGCLLVNLASVCAGMPKLQTEKPSVKAAVMSVDGTNCVGSNVRRSIQRFDDMLAAEVQCMLLDEEEKSSFYKENGLSRSWSVGGGGLDCISTDDSEGLEIDHGLSSLGPRSNKPKAAQQSASSKNSIINWLSFTVDQLESLNYQTEPAFVIYPYQDKMTTEKLEKMRKSKGLRQLWWRCKTRLNKFKGQYDHLYFNTYEEEDFGDISRTDRSVRSFGSPNFDWATYEGAKGQLKGLHDEEKKSVVLSLAHYPRTCSELYVSPRAQAVKDAFEKVAMDQDLKKAKGQQKRKRGEEEDCPDIKRVPPVASKAHRTRASLVEPIETAARVDPHKEEERLHNQMAVAMAGPRVAYRHKKKVKYVEYEVPSAAMCSPVTPTTSKPSGCMCRFLIFNENSFVSMLLPLYMLANLRMRVKNCTSENEVSEYFTAVFGVTNIPSHMSTSGVRGFQFYFHCEPFLGSFCQNAMRVLLGSSNWAKIQPIIADPAKNKGVNRKGMEDLARKRRASGDWVITQETVLASSHVDMFTGYSAYLNHVPFKVDHMGRLHCRSVPSVRDCLINCQKYDLNLSPVPPSLNTQLKSEHNKGAMEYFKKYDCSLNVLWSDQLQDNALFCVANPQLDYLFPTAGRFVSESIPNVPGVHNVNVKSIRLQGMSLAAVRYLNFSFACNFGPAGLGLPRLGKNTEKLTPAPGAEFVQSFSMGDFGTPMDKLLPLEYLNSIGNTLLCAIEKSPAFVSMFPKENGRPTNYGSLSLKVNDPKSKGKIQFPHVVINDEKLRLAAKSNRVILVRAIVPLDRAGCVTVVWPYGIEGKPYLVYIAPETMLILPATVPTSDCPRFTPSGQARAEFVFATFNDDVFRDEPRLPAGVAFENNDYYYVKSDKLKVSGTRRYMSLSGGSAKKKPIWKALNEFIGLFSSMH